MSFVQISLLGMCLLGLNSCCTKKYCEPANFELRIIPDSGRYMHSYDDKIYRIDPSSGQLLDSTIINKYYGTSNQFSLDLYTYEPIKSGHLVIHFKPNTWTDTLFNFSYQIIDSRIACNSCFPFGQQYDKVKSVRNVSFEYKGRKYEHVTEIKLQP